MSTKRTFQLFIFAHSYITWFWLFDTLGQSSWPAVSLGYIVKVWPVSVYSHQPINTFSFRCYHKFMHYLFICPVCLNTRKTMLSVRLDNITQHYSLKGELNPTEMVGWVFCLIYIVWCQALTPMSCLGLCLYCHSLFWVIYQSSVFLHSLRQYVWPFEPKLESHTVLMGHVWG